MKPATHTKLLEALQSQLGPPIGVSRVPESTVFGIYQSISIYSGQTLAPPWDMLYRAILCQVDLLKGRKSFGGCGRSCKGSQKPSWLLCSVLPVCLCAGVMQAPILHLSASEWQLISDFLQSSALSHVCHKAWVTLQRRHLYYHVKASNVSRLLEWVKRDAAIRTVIVDGKDMAPESVRTLAQLKDAKSLTGLTVCLPHHQVTDSGAQALAGMKAAPSLTTLTLMLARNAITDHGAGALAMLKEAPSLTALTLHLQCNQIGDGGAVALATLRDTPSLTDLTLNLRDNQISDRGAVALAKLKEAPALSILALNLWSNHIGSTGAQALNVLKDVPTLTTLTVNLHSSVIRSHKKRA